MSRTHRKPIHFRRPNPDFEAKLRRGHVELGVRDPDDSWSEVWGRNSKRWAKQRAGRKRRLAATQEIREQVRDFGL